MNYHGVPSGERATLTHRAARGCHTLVRGNTPPSSVGAKNPTAGTGTTRYPAPTGEAAMGKACRWRANTRSNTEGNPPPATRNNRDTGRIRREKGNQPRGRHTVAQNRTHTHLRTKQKRPGHLATEDRRYSRQQNTTTGETANNQTPHQPYTRPKTSL